MAENERSRAGKDMRRHLMGAVFVDRVNEIVYADPTMALRSDVISSRGHGLLRERISAYRSGRPS